MSFAPAILAPASVQLCFLAVDAAGLTRCLSSSESFGAQIFPDFPRGFFPPWRVDQRF